MRVGDVIGRCEKCGRPVVLKRWAGTLHFCVRHVQVAIGDVICISGREIQVTAVHGTSISGIPHA